MATFVIRNKDNDIKVTRKNVKVEVYSRTNVISVKSSGRKGPQGDPGIGIPADGNDGQIIVKDGALPYQVRWEDPLDGAGYYNPSRNKAVVCSLGLSSQLISDSTVTVINFSSPLIDPYSMYSGTNPSRITIPTGFSGAWQVNGHVHYGSGIWFIRVYIYINGVQYFTQLLERAVGAVMSVPISIVLPLSAGDYVELYTDHGSAAPEYIYGEGGGGGARTRFETIWLGAI